MLSQVCKIWKYNETFFSFFANLRLHFEKSSNMPEICQNLCRLPLKFSVPENRIRGPRSTLWARKLKKKNPGQKTRQME